MIYQNSVLLLEDYFKNAKGVTMAFLFGSRQEAFFRETADWDIGIYLGEAGSRALKEKICQDLEEILKREVDLVVLNEAPPLLTYRIIGQGLPILIRDRGFFVDLLLRVSAEADFFQDFSRDYYQIYQRSLSLGESDKARLIKILIFLENEMKDFSKFEEIQFPDYQEDIPKRRELERWVENLLNSTLDIAKIVLASEKKPLPDTYQKIVLGLETIPDFKEANCQRLAGWVKLRNILAHEYLDIRWESIKDFLDKGKPALEKFLEQAKKFIGK